MFCCYNELFKDNRTAMDIYHTRTQILFTLWRDVRHAEK
jgi:hypothetical protein